jgi:hypothetical protein
MSDYLKADEAEGSFFSAKVLESAAACLMFPIMFFCGDGPIKV